MANDKRCADCGAELDKVIYTGFPMLLCAGADNHVTGFWSFVMLWLPFNGVFMVYGGPYYLALWHWLKGDWDG